MHAAPSPASSPAEKWPNDEKAETRLRDVVGNYPFERSQICGSDRWQSRGSGPVAGEVRLRGGGDAGYQVDVVGNACKPVAVF
jgi:hypothetical protein